MNPKDFKIGIIGGGQLGKMLIQEAKKMDFSVLVLDPSPNAPAFKIADEYIVADFFNQDKIRELVEKCDVTTFEIENIDTEILSVLEQAGNKIYPSPGLLEKIKDKSKQKEMMTNNNIPTSLWERISDLNDTAERLGLPFVQKSCCGGYDGRGVFVIKSKEDFKKALGGKTFGEKFVDFEKELAVIVARNSQGEVKSFPVVEMAFDHNENICDMIIAPATVDKAIKEKAKQLAIRCIELFEGVGVFGIEMFLTKEGDVFINEIAARVHNSGHYTIESCMTSQFEQHIRAICGLPLGATDLIVPSVVINILGKEDQYGHPFYDGMNKALKIPGVNLHIYGKDYIKPYRKMGHVTIVDKDINKAIEKSNKVKETLFALSEEVDNVG